MKIVHVECFPDETLCKKLGFVKKAIVHYAGKSRVFKKLQLNAGQCAIVDEDPGSSKSAYERGLKFVDERLGISMYTDGSGNKIMILSGRLEDWILSLCRNAKVDPRQFGLPNRPKDLHEIIHFNLSKFEKLLDHLLAKENQALLQLKNWLQ